MEPERKGKASAVNETLSAYKGKYLFFVPADVLPEKGSLERLLKHFKNQKVGVVGGRPTLINGEEKLRGVEALAHLMWRIFIALDYSLFKGRIIVNRASHPFTRKIVKPLKQLN